MASTQIYKATYSGVPVYEMRCKGIAVMRRQCDSYLNATQILKVADFDKPQRTRILEREVQTGEHEKVQGGYGKYQGTWVPFDRGLQLAEQYNVYRLLQPVFDFVRGDESPPLAPKHVTSASNRPRKPRIATTGGKRKRPYFHTMEVEHSDGDVSDDESQDTPSPSNHRSHYGGVNDMLRRYKQARRSGKLHTPSEGKNMYSMSEGDSEVDELDEDDEHDDSYAQQLLRHFMSDRSDIPELLIRPPVDFDVNIIIDDEGHTSLHWAAAMGNLDIVQLLIQRDADIFRVNYKGQTALMRSVLFTNNYDLRTFESLLDMLVETIFNIDKNDQTVFHHAAMTAGWKGKVQASHYYVECLITKLSHERSKLISILNVQDIVDNTALSIAARISNKKLVRMLINAGASTNVSSDAFLSLQALMDSQDQPTKENRPSNRMHLRHKIDSLLRSVIEPYSPDTVPGGQVSYLFDTFSGNYDKELSQKDLDIKTARAELELARQRLQSTLHTVDQMIVDENAISEAITHSGSLDKDLRKLIHVIQKATLDSLLLDQENIASKENVTKPTRDDQEDPELLRQQLHRLQTSRKSMVDRLLQLKVKTSSQRYQEYKRLISMCCNIAYENLDVMLSPLLASFDDEPSSPLS